MAGSHAALMTGVVDDNSVPDVDGSPLAGRRGETATMRPLNRILGAGGRVGRAVRVLRRVLTGVFNDGFIHAGNLAYMSILALFPFLIASTAVFAVIGEASQRQAAVDAILSAVPPSVASAIGPVAYDVVDAREGWLLWVGGLFGFWTASSLIETIRDILHRAYAVPYARAFWEYRLFSVGLIFGAVLLLLLALSAQVAISAAQEAVFAWFPTFDGAGSAVFLSRLVGGLVLFGALYLVFVALTPRVFQARRYIKWPGPLFVAVWWVVLIVVMPVVLRNFFSYGLTYGSLAGVMIALFFFWLVGLGLVFGAELNAALATEADRRVGLAGGPGDREVVGQEGDLD